MVVSAVQQCQPAICIYVIPSSCASLPPPMSSQSSSCGAPGAAQQLPTSSLFYIRYIYMSVLLSQFHLTLPFLPSVHMFMGITLNVTFWQWREMIRLLKGRLSFFLPITLSKMSGLIVCLLQPPKTSGPLLNTVKFKVKLPKTCPHIHLYLCYGDTQWVSFWVRNRLDI